MRARRRLAGALVVLGLIAWVAPLVSAQDAATTLTVTSAQMGCPDGRTFCFELEADGMLEPGSTVELVFVNAASGSHNVHVTTPDQADPEHRATPADVAIVATDTLESGQEETVSLTLPSGDAMYIWCQVSGHEQIGMWADVPLGVELGADENGGSERWVPPVLIVLGLVLYVMMGRGHKA